jgi:phosphoribosylanthranilate isomerase
MNVLYPIQVKICCIRSPEEAQTALSFGAAAVGLVSEMPAGPGDLALDAIRDIVASLPPEVGTFLLTSQTNVERLVEKREQTGVNTLQLWDRLASDDYERLRRSLPDVSIVQAVHVQDETALLEAQAVAPRVDAVVLDSASPEAPYRWEPAAGRTHDWSLSRRIVENLDRPVFLAGGITPGNVADAIELVRPYGVDVCSGVRTDSRLKASTAPLLLLLLLTPRRAAARPLDQPG